jgi:hypothetical protein
MEVLTIDQIRKQYPDEWVLVRIDEATKASRPDRGSVLLHGKDYLEICYKGSEIAKNYLTTILFTGETNKNRKWPKSTRLRENPKTT